MTSKQHTQPGDLVATRAQDNVANLHDVAVVARVEGVPLSPAADLSNVIAFVRSRRGGAEPSAPAVTIVPADRPAPPPRGTSVFLQFATLVCALAVHGLLLLAFWDAPQPLASINVEAITVEVMVGDNRPEGAAATPGQNQVPPAEEVKAEEVKEVKPEERPTEVAKEEPVELPKETRQEIVVAEVPAEPPKEIPVFEPKQPEPKKTEQKKEQKKAARPVPSDAAGGSGRRSVASEANYNGMVSAHLRRHQQYPAAARSSGTTGSGMVRFSLSGNGSVTSVSVVRGTGAAVLDQELTAMVRRASPFPAPPDGQPKSFNQTVNFGLR